MSNHGEELMGESNPGEELMGDSNPGEELMGESNTGEELKSESNPGEELMGESNSGEELMGESSMMQNNVTRRSPPILAIWWPNKGQPLNKSQVTTKQTCCFELNKPFQYWPPLYSGHKRSSVKGWPLLRGFTVYEYIDMYYAVGWLGP